MKLNIKASSENGKVKSVSSNQILRVEGTIGNTKVLECIFKEDYIYITTLPYGKDNQCIEFYPLTWKKDKGKKQKGECPNEHDNSILHNKNCPVCKDK